MSTHALIAECLFMAVFVATGAYLRKKGHYRTYLLLPGVLGLAFIVFIAVAEHYHLHPNWLR